MTPPQKDLTVLKYENIVINSKFVKLLDRVSIKVVWGNLKPEVAAARLPDIFVRVCLRS